MSFWGKLAGIGQVVGGAALLTVPGGQLAGATLIGSGATTFAGDVAAEGSKKAAETQSAAADKAMALNERTYNDTRATQAGVDARNQELYAPYTGLGAGATGNLRGLVGLPPATPSAPAPSPYQSTQQAVNTAMPREDSRPGAVRRPPGSDNPQAQAAMASESAYGGGGLLSRLATAGRTVMLQAPDGARQAVPEDQAAHYMARGAVRV